MIYDFLKHNYVVHKRKSQFLIFQRRSIFPINL